MRGGRVIGRQINRVLVNQSTMDTRQPMPAAIDPRPMLTRLLALVAPRRIASTALGRMGERRAAWFYRLRGYSIIDRNVRLPGGEIDLVAQRGRTIVIAEVKTRQSLAAGEGHEAVDRAKRERMIRLGDQYAARRPRAQLRYDILSLHWTGRRFIVAHYPDAFRPIADAHRPWIWRA